MITAPSTATVTAGSHGDAALQAYRRYLLRLNALPLSDLLRFAQAAGYLNRSFTPGCSKQPLLSGAVCRRSKLRTLLAASQRGDEHPSNRCLAHINAVPLESS